MERDVLKKHIEDMEIYVPVCSIESNLEMPKTTIQQVLNGHRKLPKKWVKVLERYFTAKLYLGVNNLKFANSGEKGKLKVIDNGLISKIDFKPIIKESYDGKRIEDVIHDEPSQIDEKPPRIKGESSLDYRVRIDEWYANKKASQ